MNFVKWDFTSESAKMQAIRRAHDRYLDSNECLSERFLCYIHLENMLSDEKLFTLFKPGNLVRYTVMQDFN